MVPEVGVKITEGAKQKFGGNDFSSYFNKPSKYDYKSQQKESAKNTNTSLMLLGQVSNSMNLSKNVLKMDTSQVYLPYMNQNQNIATNERSIRSLKTNNNNSSSIDSMIVNSKITSLKHSLDSLDLIPEYEDKLENPLYGNNDNLFKNRRSAFEKDRSVREKYNVERSLSNINHFNLLILKNAQWGSIFESKPNAIREIPRSPKKPSQREFEFELGIKLFVILRTKGC